ncbi:sensor histidine kinase [Nocardia sp. NPDC052316]|uniref:sensor histidine kinase n=1 Tax=Nocardia sp. NPDC052316 TaxID=3364329 RepID=UPI0037C5FE22
MGDPEQAPLAHRLAVYRIVREALSNARKHAGDASVVIRVGYTDLATTVEITNAAGAQEHSAISSGFGLVGLRERVAALGGHFEAGPAGAGVWRVLAALPRPTQNGTAS